jgi:hypothetical protein
VERLWEAELGVLTTPWAVEVARVSDGTLPVDELREIWLWPVTLLRVVGLDDGSADSVQLVERLWEAELWVVTIPSAVEVVSVSVDE